MKRLWVLAACAAFAGAACGARRSGGEHSSAGTGGAAAGGSGASSGAAGAPDITGHGGGQAGESGRGLGGDGQAGGAPAPEQSGSLIDVVGLHVGGTTAVPAGMPDGGLVVTGVFTRDAQFGSTTLTTSGGRDAFLARYAKDGTLLWAVGAGGQLDDEGSAIVALADGSVAVAGYFTGSAVFGRGTAHEVSLQSPGPAGQIDLFVARYTPEGEVLWAQQAGGDNQEYALGLGARPDGGLVLMANVLSNSGFSGFLTTHAPGIALASFSSLGDLTWEHSFAVDEPAALRRCLSVGADGTTLFCGYSRAAVALWTGSAAPVGLPAPDPIGFLGAASKSGQVTWANHARALDQAFAAREALALPSGDSVLVGSLGSGAAFQTLSDPNAAPIDGPLLTSAAATQALVFARYNGVGSLTGTSTLAASSLTLLGAAATADNGFVVTGAFQGSFVAPGELTSAAGSAGFVARFDSAGRLAWLRHAGGALGSTPFVLTDGTLALIGRVPSAGDVWFDRGQAAQAPAAGPPPSNDGFFIARYTL